MQFIYRVHAIERMFQRDIKEIEVEYIIKHGYIIERYNNDKPYPSFLSLGLVDDVPLHVVYAIDGNDNYIVITVYRPNLEKWENNFKTRRSSK